MQTKIIYTVIDTVKGLGKLCANTFSINVSSVTVFKITYTVCFLTQNGGCWLKFEFSICRILVVGKGFLVVENQLDNKRNNIINKKSLLKYFSMTD